MLSLALGSLSGLGVFSQGATGGKGSCSERVASTTVMRTGCSHSKECDTIVTGWNSRWRTSRSARRTHPATRVRSPERTARTLGLPASARAPESRVRSP